MRRMGQGTLQDSKSWTCKGVIAMERTTREKLIELLENDDCPMFMVFGDSMDGLVDYLIAHGVTVQEWISVTERLPLNDTYILATTDGVVVPVYWHNDRFYAFTANGVATVGGVTHWMPLPQPPKGEQ